MGSNIPDDETYIKIAEWLEEYHQTNNPRRKAKTKTLIVSQMVPVVKKIARAIARRSYDPIDDLIQAGFIGLLKAIDNYSKEKNDNFRVYAGYLIIGEIKHYVRDKLNSIRVPRHIQELTLRINNFTKSLTPEELKCITSDEVASALDTSKTAVDMAIISERRRSTVSLENLYSDDDSLTYEELIPEDDYEAKADYEDTKIMFNTIINKLPAEEQMIIDMYYKQDMNQKEIAEVLNLTQMSVTRRMKKAINMISAMLAENNYEEV